MGISYIEVNTGSLERDCQEISNHIGEAESNLKGLLEILEMVNTGWKGAANAMFNQKLSEDMEFLAAVIKEASELLKCLGYAGQEYVKCENDVAETIASVRI